MKTWEGRARRELKAALWHDLSPEAKARIRALLAEPAAPEYVPGQEVPGWVAAKYASDGRAAEVEWHLTQASPFHRFPAGDTWLPLVSNRPQVEAFTGEDDRYRFRLRPAPTQPEPTPREAFEDAIKELEDPGVDFETTVIAALRAIADEVFKP